MYSILFLSVFECVTLEEEPTAVRPRPRGDGEPHGGVGALGGGPESPLVLGGRRFIIGWDIIIY